MRLTPISARRLLVAYLLDWMAGDPHWLPHPVRAMGRSIAAGEKWIRPYVRSPRGELFGGGALAASVIVGSYLGAELVITGSRHLDKRLGTLVEVLLAWTTLATRSLLVEARSVLDALEAEDLVAARRNLSTIVSRDTADLEESEIARAVIETVAESTCDGVIAPLCYLLIGGVPLGLAYKAVNTLDSMIGHPELPYRYFGRIAARIDDAANLVPSRLTALLIVASAFLAGFDAESAWRVWRRDGSKHASPNAGQSEAAMAGVLGVRLGGLNYYDGVPSPGTPMGEAQRPCTRSDARASLFIAGIASVLACSVATVLCALLRRKDKTS